MYQKIRVITLTAFITIGLALIGFNLYLVYNVYILANREFIWNTSFAYIPLGLVLIIGGWYIYRMQARQEHLQEKQAVLHSPSIRPMESAFSQSVPRICKVEDETALPPLSSEQLHILQQLFINDYKVYVKPLAGGYSNLGVFQVIPETADNVLLKPGVVVKYLSFRDILNEKKVYQLGGLLEEYPLAHTPGRPFRNWPSNRHLTDGDGGLGAVSYHLTALDAESQLQTLENIYKRSSFPEIEPFLKALFTSLEPWYARNLSITEGRPLGGPNGIYDRLYRRRNDIQIKIQELLRSSGHGLVSESFLQELETAAWIQLPFLPEGWAAKGFYNPIYWINNVLVSGQARCFKAISRYSPVHGDLHTGNILVEQKRDTRVWLIDFPNAHIGPSLQDFATMEADVKFNLIDMEQCSFDDWLRFEEQLLTPLKDPFHSLDWPWYRDWQPEGELLKAWEFIGFLRQYIVNKNLIGNDVRAYYLALLHATLPIVYRRAHTKLQKQCALTSAAWMCEYLSS